MRYFVKTWGCQMNVYDSERLAQAMEASGMTPSGQVEEADWVVLNTCNIREKAAQKLYSELGRLRTRERPPKVIVAGCVAQAEGEEVLRRAPEVVAVIGPQAVQTLPSVLAQWEQTAEPVVQLEFAPEEKFASPPTSPPTSTPTHETPTALASASASASASVAPSPSPVSAFLTIQEGCDKFCSFCVVPYTRGAQYSRPTEAIVAEAQQLAQHGAREIVLLGQNVNAWEGRHGHAKIGLGGLLTELALKVPDIVRWRYTTSHPNDVDDALIAAHQELSSLMPWVHLPVQSGSDRILRAMNRRHSVADYERTIAKFRNACPEVAFSSDFIVGYPEETEADFAQTLSLIRRVGFASSYAFVYSARPGTPAASGVAATSQSQTHKERLQRVLDLTRTLQRRFNAQQLGQEVPVLLERLAFAKEKGTFVGRTPWMQSCQVLVEDARLPSLGDEVRVRVRALTQFGLVGSAH